MNIDEIITEILAMKEQAERVQAEAARANREAEELATRIAGLAGQSLAGVAEEAYGRAQAAGVDARHAAEAATGASERLETWARIISMAGGA